MEKKLVLEKIENGYYRIGEHDKEMYTLYLFLNYGPFPDSYITFLESDDKKEFYGNVANLKKEEDDVIIEIDEFLVPDVPPFTINQKQLLKILKEFRRFQKLGADRIEIIIKNNDVFIAEMQTAR